jgi:hypothetical protein
MIHECHWLLTTSLRVTVSWLNQQREVTKMLVQSFVKTLTGFLEETNKSYHKLWQPVIELTSQMENHNVTPNILVQVKQSIMKMEVNSYHSMRCLFIGFWHWNNWYSYVARNDMSNCCWYWMASCPTSTYMKLTICCIILACWSKKKIESSKFKSHQR